MLPIIDRSSGRTRKVFETMLITFSGVSTDLRASAIIGISLHIVIIVLQFKDIIHCQMMKLWCFCSYMEDVKLIIINSDCCDGALFIEWLVDSSCDGIQDPSQISATLFMEPQELVNNLHSIWRMLHQNQYNAQRIRVS